MKRPVYLDSHATTPCDPRVLRAMEPYFTTVFGNPSSRSHSYGMEAEDAVLGAREAIGSLIHCRPKEVIFTSGATEANNLALFGAYHAGRDKGNHVVTCVTEHKAVLDPCERLEKQGARVTRLPVSPTGMIDLDALEAALTDDTILVSLMAANNEIGVLHPMQAIGSLTRARGILFHTDATQAVGKIPVDVEEAGIDLLSMSGHKMYGPKGVGALYVRRRSPRVRLEPMIWGGGQERGFRSGTLNVTGIVGLGEACRIAALEMKAEGERLAVLRDRLADRIFSELDEVVRNGDREHSLPHNLNVSFRYVDGESLLMDMEHVAVSPGSACSSGAHEPSFVLKALGLDDDLARSSIRFGLGRFTTDEEIAFAADRVIETVKRLRRFSPLYPGREAIQ